MKKKFFETQEFFDLLSEKSEREAYAMLRNAELDDYLEENGVNKRIYDVLLDVQDGDEELHRLKIEFVALYAEVYLQIVRMARDKHPEERFRDRYYRNPLGRGYGEVMRAYECDLVWCMVYAVMRLRYGVLHDKGRRVLAAIERCEPKNWEFGNTYWGIFSGLWEGEGACVELEESECRSLTARDEYVESATQDKRGEFAVSSQTDTMMQPREVKQVVINIGAGGVLNEFHDNNGITLK